MFDWLFGRKAKEKAAHEAKLKALLAEKLSGYVTDDDISLSVFTEVDFGDGLGKVKVKKIIVTDVHANGNPSDSGKKSSDERHTK